MLEYRKLDTKLRDTICPDMKIDFDKLVDEMSQEQIAALPDNSILLVVFFAKNRLGPFY